jgi:hypothetical protein
MIMNKEVKINTEIYHGKLNGLNSWTQDFKNMGHNLFEDRLFDQNKLMNCPDWIIVKS